MIQQIQAAVSPVSPSIIYPESDGKPMADNSKQFRWIFVLSGNLAAQYYDVIDVYVLGDMFWYPVKGHPEIVQAPDVFVVFGRPKGERRSYRQWEEGDIPLTVVFEILSHNNTHLEMVDKLLFYDEYGVQEYYVYDPETNRLLVYLRRGTTLVRVTPVAGFVSPRLGIRFDLSGPEMVVFGPTDQPFLTFEELTVKHNLEQQQRRAAEQRAADAQQQAADAQQQAADAQQQAADARQHATSAQERLARLAELSRKARRQQATAEELAELERLEEQTLPPSS